MKEEKARKKRMLEKGKRGPERKKLKRQRKEKREVPNLLVRFTLFKL